MNDVVVVLVSYNREQLLGQCLDAIAAQTCTPAGVVVVDNASTDGSAALAKAHAAATDVVCLPHNTGGAGGFAAGMAFALQRYPGAKWLWLMDDDTIPHPDCLEQLLRTADAYPGQPALLASEAVWVNGNVHPMNRPRTRSLLRQSYHEHATSVAARQVRTASFVSVLVDAREVRRVGLPCAAYFLWNDDFEFTARLLRRRVGLYVPSARVEHRTKKFGASDADPGERFRFEVRNKLWTYLRSMPFGVLEAPLYVGSTLRRWVRTVVGSSDRSRLLRAGRLGFAEGVRRPDTTAQVLAGTPVEDAVREVEPK